MTQANQFIVGVEIGGVLAKARRQGVGHDDLISALEACITLCRLDAELAVQRRSGMGAQP